MDEFSNKLKIGQISGSFLFLIGFILGLLLNIRVSWSFVEGMSFWGYPQEISFDPALTSEGKITQFKCPILIRPDETKEIRIRVKNPKKYAIQPILEFLVSNPNPQGNIIRENQNLSIEPSKTISTEYTLSFTNEKNFHIRYIRVFLHQDSIYPAALTKHCGVIVFQMGNLSSLAIISLGIALYTFLMLFGYWLFHSTSKAPFPGSDRIKNGMVVLGLFMLAISLANLMVWSFIAVLLLILTILSFFAILQQVV
ncbi:MAG: hypothetical protein ACYDH1_06880 [Anaerolineaceae bacterium]